MDALESYTQSKSSQLTAAEHSGKMLGLLKKRRDELNDVVYSTLQQMKNETSIYGLAHFLYHHGLSLSLSELNIEQILLFVAFKQQQFDESSAQLLISACRYLALYYLCPYNVIQLTINDNLTFLSLLQRIESHVQRSSDYLNIELVLYLNIRIPLPEALLAAACNKDIAYLVQAYQISHGKLAPQDLMLSNLLKDLYDAVSGADEYNFRFSITAYLFIRELRVSGDKGSVQATKSLSERLTSIKQSKIGLVFKLLIINELIYIAIEDQYCKYCLQVFNFKEYKTETLNEEIMLYRTAVSAQHFYLLQNQAVSKTPYSPICSLHQCPKTFLKALELVKSSQLNVTSICLLIHQICYFLNLGVMQPDEKLQLQPDIFAEIIDYAQEKAKDSLNSTQDVLVSVLLCLMNNVLYQHSKGFSQLFKQLPSQLVQFAFCYIMYNPLIHAHLQLSALLQYLDYSQKLALMQIAQIGVGNIFELPVFYRQIVQVKYSEPNMKLREYVLLKQKYNQLVDEYNTVVQSRPSYRLPAVVKEQDLQYELKIQQLQDENGALRQGNFELSQKLENLQIQQVHWQDERKGFQQQLENAQSINTMLKEYLSISQDRMQQYQEEMATLRVQHQYSIQDINASKETAQKSYESNKMLRYILQTIQNVMQSADFK